MFLKRISGCPVTYASVSNMKYHSGRHYDNRHTCLTNLSYGKQQMRLKTITKIWSSHEQKSAFSHKINSCDSSGQTATDVENVLKRNRMFRLHVTKFTLSK